MNRNTSSPNLSRQSPITSNQAGGQKGGNPMKGTLTLTNMRSGSGGGRSQADQLSPARIEGGQGGSALGSAKSSSAMQNSDRQSLMRPQSAKNTNKLMGGKKSLFAGKGGMSSGDEQTNADGGEMSLMDTHKPFLPSLTSGELLPLDSVSTAIAKQQQNHDISTADIMTVATAGQNSSALAPPQVNNFLLSPPSNTVSPNDNASSPQLKAGPSNFAQLIGGQIMNEKQILAEASIMKSEDFGPLAALMGKSLITHEIMQLYDNEKELREFSHFVQKQGQQNGIHIKNVKVTAPIMNNVLQAIEISPTGVTHLMLEDCSVYSQATKILAEFLQRRQKLKKLSLLGVRFNDTQEVKWVLDGVTKSMSLRHLVLNGNNYNELALAEPFQQLITNCRTLRDIDLSACIFNPRVLQKIFESLLKGNIWKFTLRNIQIGKVEGALLSFFMKHAKNVHHLDLSNSFGSDQHFYYIGDLAKDSGFRSLSLDQIGSDLSEQIGQLGSQLSQNDKIEYFSIKQTKTRLDRLVDFWKNLLPNRSLRVINFEKNRIGPKVTLLQAIADYLAQDDIVLEQLYLGHNKIVGPGVAKLGEALRTNHSLKKLFLANNQIDENGMKEMAEGLRDNDTLEELYLSNNNISDPGLIFLAGFLEGNRTLQILDISRNLFGPDGFGKFCEKLKDNAGLTHLICQRGRDQDLNLEPEGFECFKLLAESIRSNQFLKVIDLHGTKVSKTLLTNNFQSALQENIFLQEFKIKSSQQLQRYIEPELRNNIIIETDIIKNLKKEILLQFMLNLSGKDAFLLIKPAIKFLRCQQIEKADFSEMDNFSDEQADLLAQFLRVEAPSKYFQKKSPKKPSILDASITQGRYKMNKSEMSLKMTQSFTQGDPLQQTMMQNMMQTSSIIEAPSIRISRLKTLSLTRVQGMSDYGVILIVKALCSNETLEELDLYGCKMSSLSFEALMILVKDVNLTLHKLNVELYQTVEDVAPVASPQSPTGKKEVQNVLAIKVTEEAKLNKNILENLKPKQERSEKDLVQVKFTGSNKDIVGKFDSVLKVWRIMKPVIIDLTSEGLDDKKICQLSDLLIMHVPLIRSLCVRRNLFKDEGAKALSKLISSKLQRFIYLEMSRNEVTDEGAISILEALKINTRVKTLFVDYGNQIKNKKLVQDIQIEVEANNQINKEAKKYLQQGDDFGKLKIQDKGPTFLRCAIKCIDLLLMVEVDLSDNLLEFEHAKKLAEVIEKNRPLRKLVLQRNSLCKYSAMVLSKALQQNTNLVKLDLSENNLSDIGIASIVTPIAKQRCILQQLNHITDEQKSQILKKSGQREMGIRFLKLDHNNYSEEALKHVFALLFADKEIYVEISPPVKEVIPAPGKGIGDVEDQKNVQSQKQDIKATDYQRDQARKQNAGSLFGRFGKIIGAVKDKKKKDRDRGHSPHHHHHHHSLSPDKKGGDGTKLPQGIDPTPYNASPEGPKLSLGLGNLSGFSDTQNNSAPQPAVKKDEPEGGGSELEIKASPGKKQRTQLTKKKQSKIVSQEFLNITSEETKRGDNQNLNTNDANSTGQFVIAVNDVGPMIIPGEEQKDTLTLLAQSPEAAKRGGRSCLSKFIFGREQEEEHFSQAKKRKWWEKTPFYSAWQLYKKDQQYAKMFKCNDNIIRVVENVSQTYITFGLYLSIFFFYFTALLIPMTEGDSCLNGHRVTVFFYYAIYAVLSGVMELGFLFYLQAKVGDENDLHVNKFHVWKIVGGQLARVDFFSDVLYMTQMYWCQQKVFLGFGITCLIVSGFYQFYMLFRLIKRDQQHLLLNIERNCKLSYITEHQALAVVLDSFSLSNFESVGDQTITVPKIVSWIKSLSEDLPQFTMQVVYLLFFSDPSKSDRTGVLMSILLGLISFGMSVSHAMTAKTSTLDVEKVFKKIEERKQEKLHPIEKLIKEEYVKASTSMREHFMQLRLDKQQIEVEEENPGYFDRIDKLLDQAAPMKTMGGAGGVVVSANRQLRFDPSVVQYEKRKGSPIKKGKLLVGGDQNDSGAADSSQTNLAAQASDTAMILNLMNKQ